VASFHYQALTANGQLTEDSLDAPSRHDAIARLSAQGLNLLQLRESGTADATARTPKVAGTPPGRVPAKAREAFLRQLSSLLAAGVPLATSLHRLARETHHRAARDVWQALHDLVADGAALADAMAQFPQAFPRVTIAMVRAGETGGFLDLVLGQIAEFQSRDRDLRSKVLTALIYPCILAVLSVGVVAFLLTFFIPRFESMFTDFGATLPALTQAIVGLSTWLRKWGILVFLVLTIAVLALRRWASSERGRRQWEACLLQLPVVGPLNARFAMTRFCRMLGTLVGAGVPLVTALRVASESLGNQILVDAVREAVRRVQQGHRLASSLSECPMLFPGSVVEIVSVAEQAARLDRELIRLAETSEKELDRNLHTAVALAEPLLLFVMAGIIGTIVVGMVLPIFSLQEYIR